MESRKANEEFHGQNNDQGIQVPELPISGRFVSLLSYGISFIASVHLVLVAMLLPKYFDESVMFMFVSSWS